jgi:hypothetical protein
MASPFQRQSLTRKFIYFGLVVALLTGSLLFRKMVINADAERLRLRSVDRGEVALTDTTMHLILGGVRGFAVTYLWHTAIEHQKRHEYSELTAAVNSLTQLQPHYISPWLFQSWNLAFNVSVECDRSRDKYFYISRGLELLAQGERKNRGNESADPELRSPANPEMRYYVGFTYQLKIGHGDEKRTLRCLLDLSCIDPNKRRPEPFLARFKEMRDLEAQLDDLRKEKDDAQRGQREQAIQKRLVEARQELQKLFTDFTQANPRLVRRLREQLGMTDVRDVVNFLADNRDLPSRFRKPLETTGQTPLLDPEDQFPVVPPYKSARGRPWPNPADAGLGGVEPDVFRFTQAWYEYAQEPLPPATHRVAVEPKAVPGQSRLPKMDQYVFRQYPARAQAYIAEELEKEGWFDGEGWVLTGRFEGLGGDTAEQDVVVGKGRLNAREAWDKTYRMYLDYGAANGLYPPEKFEQLKAQAQRQGPNSRAAGEVTWMSLPLHTTNYHEFLEQSRAEGDPLTVTARRKLYQAEQLYQEQNVRLLKAYRAALGDWVDVALKFPAFGRQSQIQEDLYEAELRYMRKIQSYGQPQLEPLLIGLAAETFGPPSELSALVSAHIKSLPDFAKLRRVAMKKIIPTRKIAGPLEMTYIPDVKQAKDQRFQALTLSLAVTQLAMWPPMPLLTYEQERRLMAVEGWHGQPPGPGWRPLIDEDTVRGVRDRLGLNAPAAQPVPVGAQPTNVRPPTPPPGMPPGKR